MPATPFPPLAVLQAGWADVAVPVILAIVYVVRHVLSAIQEQREAERQRRQAIERGERRPRDPDPAPPPRPVIENPQERELRSEVEEFLRRVGQAREGQGVPPVVLTPAQTPERQTRPVRPIDPFEEPPRRPARQPKAKPQPANKPQPEAQRPRKKPPAAAPSEQTPRRGVGSVPRSRVGEHAAHLGGAIGQTDERVDARLHEKFDHQIGSLATHSAMGVPQPASEPTSAAGRIKKLLVSPGGVRDAVILGELLRRPDDRF